VNNSAVSGAADDPDRRKTAEVGGLFTVSPAVSLGIYDYYGDESKSNTTNLLDAVVTWQVTSALQLVLNADYDSFDNDGAPDPEITGVAGYINYKISNLYRVSVRAETIEFDDDVKGTKNGRVNAYTLTGGYSPAKNFDLLVEGRIDDANQKIFVDGSKFDDQQPELAIKGIYKFGL
jgi:predicted porin